MESSEIAAASSAIGRTSRYTRRADALHQPDCAAGGRSEEHTSELQSLRHLVCRLLLGKKDKRGNALPLALLARLILSKLEIAFDLLAISEPLVSTNLKILYQSRDDDGELLEAAT